MVAFSPSERALYLRCVDALEPGLDELAEEARTRLSDLEALAEVASRLPNPDDCGRLGCLSRGPDSLVDSLASLAGPDRLLRTPSKAVIGRSLLIAKVHAFSLLLYGLKESNTLRSALREAQLGVIFMLLSEDVYVACLDDPSFPRSAKERVAKELVSLWSMGQKRRSGRTRKALEAMWAARERLAPTFGTMEGASELVRLSIDLGSDWNSFLTEVLDEESTRSAMEEFLFGLSYEDIRRVRTRLLDLGLCSIDRNGLTLLLGVSGSYGNVDDGDPRSMFSFYAARRDAAHSRVFLGAPGPRHTLEELYLAFIIRHGGA